MAMPQEAFNAVSKGVEFRALLWKVGSWEDDSCVGERLQGEGDYIQKA